MDWTRPGRLDRFRFVRVVWPTYEEVGEVWAGSCKYTENMLSDLYVGGRATLLGTVDLGDDMLRAYSVSSLDGEEVSTCHFTMAASADQTAYTSAVGKSQVTLYGMLKVLSDELTDETLTVAAGIWLLVSKRRAAWISFLAAKTLTAAALCMSLVPYGVICAIALLVSLLWPMGSRKNFK